MEHHLVETRVYISSSSTMDFRTRVHNWWMRLRFKRALQHLGLLIFLMVYTVSGGLIFRHFEHPAEISRMNLFNNTLSSKRQHLIKTIVNNTNLRNLDMLISFELHKYELELQDSFDAGISIIPSSTHETVKWTTLKAVFFSSTVLTTIGYGNIVPTTTEGRAFCIVFALVGIPLTLSVIADWGRILASAVSTIVRQILPAQFRNAMAHRTSSYALWGICFLFVYLAAGAAIFVIWEEDWTFFEGFYFCFITMTTIGFGDLVPKQPKYMLLCTLYILVGLALTSTIIELVRRQYAQSWRQLQALRGPLTENFRKLAENAQGVDMLALQQDLMKVLTVVTMPKKSSKKEKKAKQKDWENAIEAAIRDITASATEQKSPPVVQIVIYESSV